MEFSSLHKRSLKVSRGFTYTYYTNIEPPHAASTSQPALLFCHGFPDSAHLWSRLTTYLSSSQTRRIIVPDLLGVGDTSQPTDPSDYAFDKMTQDILELCRAEGVNDLIAIGHDWGSGVVQRLYLYAGPTIVKGLVLFSVPYQVPTPDKEFSIDATNEMTTKFFGYGIFEYWKFFARDPEAPRILDDNLDRFYMAVHGQDPEGGNWMQKMLCVDGALKSFLLSDQQIQLSPYAQDAKMKEEWLSRFRAADGSKRESFVSSLCYYKAKAQGYQDAAERSIAKERYKIEVPVLYVGSDGDAVCRMEIIDVAVKQGLLPDLEVHRMENCGHWIPLERPEDAAGHLETWLEKKFAPNKASV